MLGVGEARQVVLVDTVDLDRGRQRLREVEGHEEVVPRIPVRGVAQVPAL